MTNIDMDKRMFTYCTMNAILHAIPSINIWGDSLALKFWDGYAVIPVGGLGTWHRVPKENIQAYMISKAIVGEHGRKCGIEFPEVT